MVNTSQEKQGYKYTEEFGYIPEDWEVFTLGQIGNVSMCKRIMKNETKEIGEVPFYKIGTFGCEPDAYISHEIFEKYKRKYSYPKIGDILISAAGTIGRTIVFDGRPAYFQDSNIVWLEHNNTKILNKYLYYWYKTDPWYTTTGGTIARLYNDNITNTKVLKPSIKEQEKIAEVLGDIDNLIDKTQQLINKKKDIKTATMQKLLTPKEGWKFKTIDSLGESISVKNLSWEDTNVDGKTKCILYGELFTTYNEVAKNIVSKTNKEVYLAKINDLLFPTSTTVDNMSLIAPSCLQENNVGVGGDLFVFRPYNSNGIFLSYLINGSLDIKRQLANRAQGLTIIHLHYDNIKDIELPIPDKIEQDKIATILSDMDAEIEALEKELSKYKDLKIGMMQQLLTGKIRLIGKSVKQDDKVVSIEDAAAHKVANDEFKDAILISVLAYKFGNEQYPLGAFRRQKLSYFYKRHANMNIDEYTKKAIGPYNSKMKYQGAENIAIRNKYVKKVGNRGIVATNLISKAEEYYNRYYNSADMQWLDANFHYENNNNLEVLATVDYAINDLVNQNKAITLANIKTYIASDEEWRPKLELDYFTDNAIIKAMEKIKKLFNSY